MRGVRGESGERGERYTNEITCVEFVVWFRQENTLHALLKQSCPVDPLEERMLLYLIRT